MKTILKYVIFALVAIALGVYGAEFCKAEDIELGKLNLTKNQLNRMSDLQKNSDTIKGFSAWDGVFTVHTKRPITSSERALIIADLQALSDTPAGPLADKEDFKNSPFKGLEPDQAEAWIDSNVNSLQDVKAALKKMARIQSYLIRQSDLDR